MTFPYSNFKFGDELFLPIPAPGTTDPAVWAAWFTRKTINFAKRLMIEQLRDLAGRALGQWDSSLPNAANAWTAITEGFEAAEIALGVVL